MEIYAIDIDLGKTVFHLVGLDQEGKVVVRKKCSRNQLLTYTANLQVKVIGMEACSGSHFLGRALREQGHEVRLMPAQYVKPYVKTNKSDYLDAKGQCCKDFEQSNDGPFAVKRAVQTFCEGTGRGPGCRPSARAGLVPCRSCAWLPPLGACAARYGTNHRPSYPAFQRSMVLCDDIV